MKPLFIFSLPKAGSTLLQRILGASPYISTATEPWILLPFIYIFKPNGIRSEYWHKASVTAIEDFIRDLPEGKKDYLIELKTFIYNLYKKSSDVNSSYFLDKTPRYSIISHEIMELFPEGKFIFLWRNPLAVVSSTIQRWYKGKWKIFISYIDFYKGISSLLDTYISKQADVHALNFENLLHDPYSEIQQICLYLNIPFTDEMLSAFHKTPLLGRMTEHTGSKVYKTNISKEPLTNWPSTFNNSYRRLWAKKYLNWIGEDRLKIMGYDYSELLSELRSNKNNKINVLASDLTYSSFLKLKSKLFHPLANYPFL